MGDPSTGLGYGYALYGMSPEQAKKYIVEDSNPTKLATIGLEKAYQNFLDAEPPELNKRRTALKAAEERAASSKTLEDSIASSKASYFVKDYGSQLKLTPGSSLTTTPNTTDFEKLITNQEPISEEKKQPPKEEVFEKLLNKINTPQKEQPADPFRRGSTYGDYAPQEEQTIDAFGRGSWGDYAPQEEAPTRGRRDTFSASEKENVQDAPKTKANDFLEAYKGVIETNTTNNKNEDIAAVYKPSVPPVETWIEKLDKDALLNKNKPIPTTIPYRRGTGLGDHMGADASEQQGGRGSMNAFGEYVPQEEEQPRRGSRNAFNEYVPQEEVLTRGYYA